MRICLLLVIAVGFSVTGVPAQDKAGKKDSENIQGTWAVTAAEVDEKKLSEEDIKGWTLDLQWEQGCRQEEGEGRSGADFYA